MKDEPFYDDADRYMRIIKSLQDDQELDFDKALKFAQYMEMRKQTNYLEVIANFKNDIIEINAKLKAILSEYQ